MGYPKPILIRTPIARETNGLSMGAYHEGPIQGIFCARDGMEISGQIVNIFIDAAAKSMNRVTKPGIL
ncbi:MAG: hypothetical protein IH589_02555 [Anaerolineales bacterium]|nr:hypothetical protein [Anaerolineales bacterium]